MSETSSNDRLSNVIKGQILTSQADLDPRDKPLLEIADWCQQRGTIVVLKSGMILTIDAVSRDVQNCKTMLINRGIRPGRVMVATQQLITLLLANVAGDEDDAEQEVIEQAESSISTQQQRLRLLVQEAINADISDIHIEVRPEVARIRFRKYGELYLHAEWFPRLGREIASVAFNKETDHATAHFNPLIPQDASMPLRIAGQEVRLRLASMPAHGGFDVVMRILGVGDQANIVTLEQLGYTPEQVYIIKRAVQMPHGAVLLSGPTGSGKTTTLASCMRLIRDTRKVYTIEDPVEKVVPTVTQVPVNTDKDDRSFASFGRAALRMDPDYIVLGEMRDEDTANVMIRAAITGHLVFSTIHTNSAPGIITRLVDMGISQTLLSDSNVLVCLIFQRLVPKLCKECNISIHDSKHMSVFTDRWKIFFGDSYENIRARGNGCSKCQKTGVGGRVVVAEVIWVDEPGRRFIRACDMIGWESYLKQKGWKNYRDRTIEMVKEGLVDPGDAEALVGEISVYSSEEGFDYSRIREEMDAHSKGS